MRTTRRIFWNTLVLISADIVRLVIGLILTTVLARALGAAELGRFTYTISLVTILTSFGELGLSMFYVREAQLGSRASLAGAFIGTRVLAGTIVAAGLAVYAVLETDRAISPLLLMGSLLLWLGIWPSIVAAVLRARELMVYEAAAKIIATAATTAGGIGAILVGYGVKGVLAAMLAVGIGMMGYYTWLAVRFLPRPSHLWQPFSAFANFLRGAWPFASLSILVMIYFRIDSVMLFALKGEESLGQYSAAYRVLEITLLLPWAISASALPPVTRYLQARKNDVLRASLKLIQVMLTLAIPVAAFSLIFSSRLFPVLYGPGFTEAGNVFRVLVFAVVAVYAASVTSTLISASARPGVNTGIALIMAIINIGLNFALIPHWSGVGAAAATAVTEWTGLLLGTLYIRRAVLPLGYAKYFIKPTVASCLAAIVASAFPTLVALPVFAICYVVGLWVLGGMTREDIVSFRTLVLRPSTVWVDDET